LNWEGHKEKLANGESVQFRPRGNSMSPIIGSGDQVTVEPVTEADLKKGDVVFCCVKGKYYVHLVQAIQEKMGGRRFQIGNNKNHTNGTIGFNSVFGKVTKVES